MSNLLSQKMKRAVDLFISCTALIILSPLLLICAIVNRILNGSPAFYISHRHVSTKRQIRIPKFRTMVKDACSEKYQLEARFMRNGFLDIPLKCEVYTGFGRMLERVQIVEIPQFLCVLRGDLSIIGNRPLPSRNLELLKIFPGWEKRFDSPSGITGISQIVGKLDLSPEERLRLECLYSEVYKNGNLLKCDLMIALFTIKVIIVAKGIPMGKAENFLLSCLPSMVPDNLSVRSSQKAL